MKSILYFVGLLSIFSCSTQSSSQLYIEEVVKVDIKQDLSLLYSDYISLIDTIKVIPLKDSSIIGITNVIFNDNCYYVLDKWQNTIFVFDSCGNSLFGINRRGRAKEEYLEINDIMVVENTIQIFDASTSKIISYDKKNGNFIDEYVLEGNWSNLIATKNHIVAYNSSSRSESDNMVSLFNSNRTKLKEYIPRPSYLEQNMSIGQDFPLTIYDDEIYLAKLLSNNIYKIEEDSIFIKYSIDFGSKNINDDFIENISTKNANEFLETIAKSDYPNNLDYFRETQNYLYFMFFCRGQNYTAYYNKKTKRTHLFLMSSFDEDNRYWSMPSHIGSDDEGNFISILNTESIGEKTLNTYEKQNYYVTNQIVENMKLYKTKYTFYLLLYQFNNC